MECGGFVCLADRNFDQIMRWRERAGGIGDSRVSGQKECLATASSEVFCSAIASAARLMHPLFAAKTAEGWGFVPEPA